jgi:predicted DNA-binding WGR domain protein
MTATVLSRIDPGKKVHRFYCLDVQPDLFGQWCLMREWGRIGIAGRERSFPFPTRPQAQDALDKHRHVKERRGYARHAGEIRL